MQKWWTRGPKRAALKLFTLDKHDTDLSPPLPPPLHAKVNKELEDMARGAIGSISRTWCFLHSGAKIWSFACTDFAQKRAVTMKYKMRRPTTRQNRNCKDQSLNSQLIWIQYDVAPLYPRCSLCVVQIRIKNRWQFSWYTIYNTCIYIYGDESYFMLLIDCRSAFMEYLMFLSLSLSLWGDDLQPCNTRYMNYTALLSHLSMYTTHLIILSHYMRDNF